MTWTVTQVLLLIREYLVPTIKADIKMLHSTLSQDEYKFQLEKVGSYPAFKDL